jgi:hypothetical protein
MNNYKKPCVYTTETDLSTVKVVNSSLYGTFGIPGNTPNGPIFTNPPRKPKITYSFGKK